MGLGNERFLDESLKDKKGNEAFLDAAYAKDVSTRVHENEMNRVLFLLAAEIRKAAENGARSVRFVNSTKIQTEIAELVFKNQFNLKKEVERRGFSWEYYSDQRDSESAITISW